VLGYSAKSRKFFPPGTDRVGTIWYTNFTNWHEATILITDKPAFAGDYGKAGTVGRGFEPWKTGEFFDAD
jgi:hypothetical protein